MTFVLVKVLQMTHDPDPYIQQLQYIRTLSLHKTANVGKGYLWNFKNFPFLIKI